MDLVQHRVGNVDHLAIHNENITKVDLVIILLHNMEEVVVQDLRVGTNTSNVTHITVELMVDGDHGRHGENGIAVLLIAERKDQVHRQKPDHDPECVIIHHQDVTENHVLDQVYNTIVKPAILIVAELMVVGDHGRHGVLGIVVLLIAERKDQVHQH